jgi:hypothetical protein
MEKNNFYFVMKIVIISQLTNQKNIKIEQSDKKKEKQSNTKSVSFLV